MIRIRDNRDVRGPLCGTLRHQTPDGRTIYLPVTPFVLVTLKRPQMREYFDARLRGAFTTLGELP